MLLLLWPSFLPSGVYVFVFFSNGECAINFLRRVFVRSRVTFFFFSFFGGGMNSGKFVPSFSKALSRRLYGIQGWLNFKFVLGKKKNIRRVRVNTRVRRGGGEL